jgi:hypothetical protein
LDNAVDGRKLVSRRVTWPEVAFTCRLGGDESLGVDVGFIALEPSLDDPGIGAACVYLDIECRTANLNGEEVFLFFVVDDVAGAREARAELRDIVSASS